MSSIRCASAFATCVLVVGLTIPRAEAAVPIEDWYLSAPGDSCQLSIPTIDTKVRPRANGYRNEGTASNFVICGYGNSRILQTRIANVAASSMDGSAHSMSCTFTAGSAPDMVSYVTKTLAVPATGFDFVYVSAEDFGGSYGDAFDNYHLSVTCNLPPMVAIVHLETNQGAPAGG